MDHLRVFNPEKQRAEFTPGAIEALMNKYPRLTKEMANVILNECDLYVDHDEPFRLPTGESIARIGDYYIKLKPRYYDYGVNLIGSYEYLQLWPDKDGVLFKIYDIEN